MSQTSRNSVVFSAAARYRFFKLVLSDLIVQRLTGLWIGSKPQHIAVGVFKLHLIRPGAIPRLLPHLQAARPPLREQRVVLEPDPNPSRRFPRLDLRKHNAPLIPRHRTYDLACPIELEAKHVDVVLLAPLHVAHRQDRNRTFNSPQFLSHFWSPATLQSQISFTDSSSRQFLISLSLTLASLPRSCLPR